MMRTRAHPAANSLRRVDPAVQLGSVALRYGTPLARPAATGKLPGGETGPAEPPPSADVAFRRDASLARLEGVLLLAREPLSTRRLAQVADLVDGTAARTLIRRLNACYDGAGCAFRVEEVAGGFQLLTRPQFGPWLRRWGRSAIETRLSAPALETLAVVAYRQPVLRVQIEAVRGVDCGEILRQLMDRDLVRIGGRSDQLGRPYLYNTTRRFLQVFGLRNLDDLPRAANLRAPAGPPPESSASMAAQDRPVVAPQPDPGPG